MQHPSERSVDEILKAIQKVIESDNRDMSNRRSAAKSEAEKPADEGVMLNGGAAGDDEAEFLVTPENISDDEDGDILDLGDAGTALADEESGVQPELQADAPPKAKAKIPPERIIAQIEETLTSERAAEAMRRSLSNLSLVSEEPARTSVPAGETTIEQLVREMLRPMLAQWLDDNLPPMVERLVKAEIARIAGKRG